MKKTISIISAIAAGAAMLLSSCMKQEMPESKTELTYNFTIGEKDSYGADTKAVKTCWAEGDKIYIVFDNVLPTSSADFLILKYTSGAWTVDQTPKTAPTNTSGTLDALYYENSNPSMTFDSYGAYFDSSSEYAKYMSLFAYDVSYSVSGTTLSATISMSLFDESSATVQFCITGLPTDNGDWNSGLARNDTPTSLWIVQGPQWQKLNNRFNYRNSGWVSGSGSRAMIYKEGDGHYIYPNLVSTSYSSSYTWTIKLTNSTYGTWTKDFTKTIAAKGAVKMSGPTNFDNSSTDPTDHNGWTKLVID